MERPPFGSRISAVAIEQVHFRSAIHAAAIEQAHFRSAIRAAAMDQAPRGTQSRNGPGAKTPERSESENLRRSAFGRRRPETEPLTSAGALRADRTRRGRSESRISLKIGGAQRALSEPL